MATINNIFQGIEIIRKYETKEQLEEDCFQAINNQIYCGNYSGDKMTPQDLAEIKKLGWFNHEGSWSIFT